MFTTSRGTPFPYGASKQPQGVNFALVSEYASSVTLCLFDYDTRTELAEIPLSDKTGHVWHICVDQLPGFFAMPFG